VSNKRILITGAAGFLGSHLCDRFVKEGMHVMGMDNLITGDLKNIQHLFQLENFEFYHCDVSKFIHVSGKLDYILHFASPASPIDYLKIPIQMGLYTRRVIAPAARPLNTKKTICSPPPSLLLHLLSCGSSFPSMAMMRGCTAQKILLF